VSGSARDRLRETMLELVSSQGYRETAIEEVIAAAGVSRVEFEELYPSKEALAVEVLEERSKDCFRAVLGAYEAEERWPDSLRAGAYAMAEWMAKHPREVRYGPVEMLWAGEQAQVQREIAFRRFRGMVDGGRTRLADPDSLPESTADQVIGSGVKMLTTRAMEGGNLDYYALVPHLMAIAVRPFLGEEAAARELRIPPPPRTEAA
jgi:AcrR family transcriptional regulator